MLNIELIESDQGRSHELVKGFFFWGGGVQQQPKTPLKIMDSTDLGGGGLSLQSPLP